METDLQCAILKTLSYFQVFQHPLRKEEIWKFISIRCDPEEVHAALTALEEFSIVFNIDGYYCLCDNASMVETRKEGNRLGKSKLKKAMRISRFLGAFPFVEAVCISGSLSKDCASKDSDLDYFIVTAPNRLWTARNFMHLFRKMTFLVNAQHSFCMNYYVSLQDPEISPKNLYTAIELATLKITEVSNGMKEIVNGNRQWVSAYLPNTDFGNNLIAAPHKKRIVTRIAEWLINKTGGDNTEARFYESTMKRWAKKWGKMKYPIGKCMQSAGYHFNTPLNYPKHLPESILETHEIIYRQAERRYKIAISNITPTIEEPHYH